MVIQNGLDDWTGGINVRGILERASVIVWAREGWFLRAKVVVVGLEHSSKLDSFLVISLIYLYIYIYSKPRK